MTRFCFFLEQKSDCLPQDKAEEAAVVLSRFLHEKQSGKQGSSTPLQLRSGTVTPARVILSALAGFNTVAAVFVVFHISHFFLHFSLFSLHMIHNHAHSHTHRRFVTLQTSHSFLPQLLSLNHSHRHARTHTYTHTQPVSRQL